MTDTSEIGIAGRTTLRVTKTRRSLLSAELKTARGCSRIVTDGAAPTADAVAGRAWAHASDAVQAKMIANCRQPRTMPTVNGAADTGPRHGGSAARPTCALALGAGRSHVDSVSNENANGQRSSECGEHEKTLEHASGALRATVGDGP